MNKIVITEQAVEISKKLRNANKSVVLAGGCFDILHIGHIRFLKEAKQHGDKLFIMLEHDDTIKQLKGPHRPLNPQKDRAEVLASLETVDYVVLLPKATGNTVYDNLVNLLKPAIIATTAGDTARSHKERQAKQIGAKVIDVTQLVTNQSTTKLVHILHEL